MSNWRVGRARAEEGEKRQYHKSRRGPKREGKERKIRLAIQATNAHLLSRIAAQTSGNLKLRLDTWPVVNEVQEERRYCNSMRARTREERERARRTIDNRKYALIFDARGRARHVHGAKSG